MPVIVQTVQGRVSGLWGSAQIRQPDGSLRLLKMGDLVHRGDVILTSQDGIVQLTPEQAPAPKVAETEVDRVIEALNQDNPTVVSAAGLTGGGDGGFEPGLRVGRVQEAVTPVALAQGFDNSAVQAAQFDTLPQQQVAAPTATSDVAGSLAEDGTPLTFDPRVNDTGTGNLTVSSVNGQPISVGNPVTIAGQGTVALNLDGTLTFTPAKDYNGTVTFPYTVTDGSGQTAASTITVNVTPVED
ncbi:MAG: hypothetical protein RJA98_3854, partial [Pseudomonadota bacterium]